MSPFERRHDVLLRFAQLLQDTGRAPVPDPGVLREIAESGRYVGHPTTAPHQQVLEELLKQVSIGVSDPVGRIRPELLPAPASSDPGPSGGDPNGHEQELLAALLRWRENGLRTGDDGFSRLKESQVRALVRSGIRDRAGVSKLLPSASLRRRVDEVLAILTEQETGTSAPTAAPAPASPAEAPDAVVGAAGATTPSSVQVTSTEQPGADTVDPADFAPYDPVGAKGEPSPLRASATRTGAWSLQWRDDQAEGFVVYRVVSGDEYLPWNPDTADLVAVTAEPRAVDERPFSTAVRHYQVWRHGGPDRPSAVDSQPLLHAEASVVGQVLHAQVAADAGRVIGRWESPEGVDHVQVYRVPIRLAARAGLSPEHRILSTGANLEGFIDSTVTRGARYLYLAASAAEVDGVMRLSTPLTFDVAVSAVLEGVTDLQATQREDAGATIFDLSWTDPPAGRVHVYRTSEPPRPGAATKARQAAALPQMKLEERDRLPNPVVRGPGGRATMAEVPCPDGWTRAYFTPVTVLDDMAQVGGTTSATFVPPVRVPRLVERVGRQVLTFAWPPGAASVVAYVAPSGASTDAARAGRQCEIFWREYVDLGGLSFPFPLPELGCSVHVVPIAFSGGQKIAGTPVSVEYPGLLRLAYTTSLKRMMFKPHTLTVDITSAIAVEPPPFVLVHGADRLPLHLDDGEPLEAVRDGDETMFRTRRPCPDELVPGRSSRWRFDVKGRSGFVRLFVDLPTAELRRVALLDPPLAGLWLGSRPPARQ